MVTTISLNEMRARAAAFAAEYTNATREEGDAQEFEIDFLNIFGINRRKVAAFEHKVKLHDGSNGYIDLFWKGMIIIEMKSLGKNLEDAFKQAKNYADALPQHELPKAILVCDFTRFHLYDLDNNAEKTEFLLADLPQFIDLFIFLAGYTKVTYKEQDPVNIEAAELMGKLHDRLKATGYCGHQLEVYLVRMLFCLFADDTGIFEHDIFIKYIVERTNPDGSDVAMHLHKIFETLNKSEKDRSTTLDENLRAFPYVNGGLFAEKIDIPDFDAKMREAIIDCARLNWSSISPAIFGSMFQSVMNENERRNLGAHYTSETNILKLICPLFLDNLYSEFEKINSMRTNRAERLATFHNKLASLRFLDPACGCGNFLVITYRELRELEIAVIQAQLAGETILDLDMYVKVNVHQFFGIEIEEFPSLIAQTALWLMDHQMNIKVRNNFGKYYVRIPLTVSAKILCANALQTDWQTLIPKNDLSFILGNPPFVGFTYMSEQQKKDMSQIFENQKNTGVLDFVTAWYKKAAEYIQGTLIECAFVSTNSICQGETVAPLWNLLFSKYNIKINFAHQTFKWSNEARGKAAVYCIIVGFSTVERAEKTLFLYDTVTSEPHKAPAQQINAYLVDAPNVIVESRTESLCTVSQMQKGSIPVDGGNLIIEEKDYADFIAKEPNAQKYIKQLLGSEEFINNKKRYCLWLVDANPSELKKMPLVLQRIEAVRQFRLASTKEATRKYAQFSTQFMENRQPKTDYILVPRVSSEKRKYVPMGFVSNSIISSDANMIIPNATLYEFAILTSAMHMAWMRYVCGRLKSDYRYSKDIVYNNFPWPAPNEKQKSAIEAAAQTILDVRKTFADSSFADLYDPRTMPPALVKAHEKLDKLTDKAYGKDFIDDTERVSHLFERYKQLTADLFTVEKKRRRR